MPSNLIGSLVTLVHLIDKRHPIKGEGNGKLERRIEMILIPTRQEAQLALTAESSC